MKRIYGALSPFDHKTICPTWQELRDEIKKLRLKKSTGDSDEYSIEEYQLRFRQMKSVMLRKGLLDKVDNRFPNWFNLKPYTKNLTIWNDSTPKETSMGKKRGRAFNLVIHNPLDKTQREAYIQQQRYIEMCKFVETAYDCSKMGYSYQTIFSVGYMYFFDKNISKIDSIKPKIFHSTMGKIGERHIKIVTEYEKLLELAKKYPDIKPVLNPDPTGEGRVVIVINNNVSMTEALEFVEDEWPSISKNSDRLATSEIDALLPTALNLRIVELKDSLDQGYDDIVSVIIKEFKKDDPEAKITYGSVKQAYYRTHIQLAKLIPEK